MTNMFVYAALSQCARCGRQAGMRLDPALSSQEMVALLARLRRKAVCTECGYRPDLHPLWSGPPNAIPTQESEVARWKSCETIFAYHCQTRGPVMGWAQPDGGFFQREPQASISDAPENMAH